MSFFGKIGSFLRNLAPDAERPDVYHPRERLIYYYWNGAKHVAADPIALYKRMMAQGPELSIDIKVANSASKDAGKAHDALVGRIRTIFDLKPLTDGGLSELESAQLLDHFLVYCERLKKNSSPSPTSSTTTADSPTSSPTVPPTSNSSVSGSTANGPSTDGPGPSPMASGSPSVA